MMKNHTQNLFRVNNLSELNFSFRLVDFKLPLLPGKEDRYNKQLHKIEKQVASLSGGPAAIVKRNGKHSIAIPVDKHIEDTTINAIPHNIKITLLPDVHHVSLSKATPDNLDVIEKFLDFEIRRTLSAHPLLWKFDSSHFIMKQAARSAEDSNIEIYEGFSYKLIRTADNSYYICLDLNTKYIDKLRLSEYISIRNVDSREKTFRGRRFVYLNNDDWYPVELAGFGDTIQEQEIDYKGESISVYQYILNKAKRRRSDIERILKPEDIAILYTYPNRTMEPHSGASSLAKMLYSPKDKAVQSLHRYSIKDPRSRFDAIQNYIRQFFLNISYNGKAISISQQPLIEKLLQFNLPALKFSNDKILSPGHYSAGANTSPHNFAQERKQYLLTNGILNRSSFDEQYLIVPDSMNRKLVDAFQKNAEHQIKKMASQFGSFKVIRYPAKANQPATFQAQTMERVLQQNGAMQGFALFILPDLSFESNSYVEKFHDCLKNKFYPDLKVQCALAYKIQSFFYSYPSSDSAYVTEYKVPEEKKPKFKSYLLNLVLEYLIVNRKWPYALAKDLHYDVYIGIDVHDRYAGFTFFFKNGENIFFIPERVPLKNRADRTEKLKAGLLTRVIYEQLKLMLPHFCPDPNGIVIIRDGRSFGEEGKALKDVISHLHEEGILTSPAIASGVVDLHKQSAIPLRVAALTNSHNKLENPAAGIVRMIGEKEGFLFNTGFPFQIRGSAKPLHISLREGNNLQFIKVLEDLFCQTMLAFSAPDRSNSLPVVIKLIDTLLEPLSGGAGEVDEEWEDSIIENY